MVLPERLHSARASLRRRGTWRHRGDDRLGIATSSSSYYDHSGDSTSENTWFYAQAGFLGFYYNYPRPMASAVRTYGDKAFVQGSRAVVLKGENTFDYVVGAFYQDEKGHAGQVTCAVSRPGGQRLLCGSFPACVAAVTGDRDFAYDRCEKYEDKALFGNEWTRPTRWGAHRGGVRWFDYTSKNNTFMDLPLYASLSDPTTGAVQTARRYSKETCPGVCQRAYCRSPRFRKVAPPPAAPTPRRIPTGNFAEAAVAGV